MRFLRAIGIVAALTLASNVLGYVRDVALAAQFGATDVTDAYFAALLVPNTLHVILLSGSIATIFVPIFLEALQRDRSEAWRLACSVFNLSGLLLTGLTLLALPTRQVWVPLLFPGFSPATEQLTERLTLLLLPTLTFIGLASLITAMLHSFEQFAIPALAPLVGNLIVIGAILFLSGRWGIDGVAVAVTVSMFVQLVMQLPMLWYQGAHYWLTVDWGHPALRHTLRLSVPLVAYLLVAYGSVFVERSFASQLGEGTVSAFNYAVRIFSIPVGIIAGSVGTVIYPRLAAASAGSDSTAFAHDFSRALGATLFVLTPLSIWLWVFSEQIIEILFGYGRFTPENVQTTSLVLRGYLLGMVGTGVARIVQRASYAMQDTTMPLLVEGTSFAIYCAVAFALTAFLGAHGLAIARGLAFVFVAAAIYFAFKVRYPAAAPGWRETGLLVGQYAAAAVPAATVWQGSSLLTQKVALFSAGRVGTLATLALSAVGGLVVFLATAHLLGINETVVVHRKLAEIRDSFKRNI